MTPQEKPDFVLQTPIATTREKLWAALTQGEHTKNYHFAQCELKSDLTVGSRFDHFRPDGTLMLGGEVIAIDPPSRLEMTFEPGWIEGDAEVSRCAYEISEADGGCMLTIIHYTVPEGQGGLKDGWQSLVNSLKTYLENAA